MTGSRTAQITGPLSGGRGWPFGSPATDVRAHGCVIEEFLFEGEAVSYRPVPGSTVGQDGLWETEPDETAPYRLRFFVVRPADPTRFNGVVLVNWLNVTAGFDIGIPGATTLEHGFAWVGVTAQNVAVVGQPATEFGPATTGLAAWDPERYGTLHHPGDGFSYDIFSQAGRAVGPDRPRDHVDPLGGLHPRMVLASGGSQSAMRLGSYLNIAHQRDRVFDGFFPLVHMGLCPYPPDQPLLASFTPLEDGTFAGSSRIRDDSGTPVLVLCSETETPYTHPVRQPDSDTFRFWELAGTAHVGASSATEVEAVFARDGVVSVLSQAEGNTVDWSCVSEAALAALVQWVDAGRPPRSFPLIDVDPGVPASIRRDEFGNATGGIRLPDVALPTGMHHGSHPTDPARRLTGLSVPLGRRTS
jgi:hypothetical protein